MKFKTTSTTNRTNNSTLKKNKIFKMVLLFIADSTYWYNRCIDFEKYLTEYFQVKSLIRVVIAPSRISGLTTGLPVREETYPLIFALIYGRGLRVGEVSRLCRKDVDLDESCS